MIDEKELQRLRERHVEDTSLTEMMGACRCGSLIFPCQTSRLVAEVDRLRAQVAAVEALLRYDDFDPYVHANEGCQGEPDCARCWADDVRNALRGHRG